MTSCPPCFFSASRQKAWQKKADQVGEEPDNYCRDCSFEYQQKMIPLRRCRFPDTAFVEVVNEDGESEVVGVRA